MKGGKDEGKSMDPLFPRLHINDADKGGPKAPPRNKMALFEEHNAPSQSGRFSSGSMPMLPQTSSSQIVGSEQNVFPSVRSLPGSSHLGERYHSYNSTGVNLNTPRTNSEPRMSEPKNYQNPCVSGNSMETTNCCHIRRFEDKSDLRIPFHGNLQSQLDKEEIMLNACLKRPMNHEGNHADRNSKLSHDTEKHVVLSLIRDNKALKSIDDHKKHVLVDEQSRLLDRNPETCQDSRISQENKAITDGIVQRKRSAAAMEGSLDSFPQLQDNKGLSKSDPIKTRSEDTDCGPVHGANADINQEISDNSVVDSIEDITPDDVVALIGEELFWKARNKILHQQKTFSMQIFELHRLTKLQRLLSRSPEALRENNLYLNKPSTKYPPRDKLLHSTPPDPSPASAKPKLDALKLNPGDDHGAGPGSGKLPPPTPEKANPTPQSTPKPPTPPTITNTKLAPWCLPGNQWLVPVKSPTEGLIYKPYTGPIPPTFGIMAPVFGNCGPISVTTIGGTVYGVPAADNHGIARLSATPVSQSLFQPYPVPMISSSGLNVENEQTIPPCQSSCNLQGNLHGSRSSDMQGSSESSLGDARSCFPTTMPLLQVSKDQCNEQPVVQVIKVVPHNPKSAPESAARIFRSIQEERNKHDRKS